MISHFPCWDCSPCGGGLAHLKLDTPRAKDIGMCQNRKFDLFAANFQALDVRLDWCTWGANNKVFDLTSWAASAGKRIVVFSKNGVPTMY